MLALIIIEDTIDAKDSLENTVKWKGQLKK